MWGKVTYDYRYETIFVYLNVNVFDLLSKRGKLPGTKFIFPLKIWLSIFVVFKLTLF